jgi:hypothetical protein
VFENYCKLKQMSSAGELAVDSFVYCDNSQRGEPRVWLEVHQGDRPPIIPTEKFNNEALMYRAHPHLITKMLQDEPDAQWSADVRRAYNALIQGMMTQTKQADSGDSR